MDVTAGALFGTYQLEARLGGGSFGAVWRARDTSSNATVALKILSGSFSSDEATKLRTDVELLAAAAAAGSTHVVKVLGGGLEPAPHVVMELLEGTDLAAALADNRRLPQVEVVAIGEAVADALAALGHVGIIHRDVKPANIMLGPDGGVKLTDFGIAKIVGFDTATSTGQLPLTMAYAAPEVWDGKASSASDLYALGVVLYQCLAGRLPFMGSYSEVYKGHISGTPDFDLLPADTTPALRSFIESCMAKEVAARPSDPEAALAQLRRAKGELEARQGAAGGHPPVAFGPWQIVAPHPTRAWAWGARHETTGDRAIVEVCFGPNASLGETLHRAVDANPVLVPLGAERLLGTNRLILRPDEAWPVPPPSGPFAFWVAREELPVPPPATVGQPELRRVVESVVLLRNTANAAGVRLDLGPSALVALPDGNVHVRRPGLPSDSTLDADAAALDSIRRLPLDLALTATVARAQSLQALSRELGVVDVSSPEATLPPTVVIRPGAEESSKPVVAPLSVQPLPVPGGDRRGRRRVALAIGLGAIVVALVAAAAFGAFFAGDAHPSASGSGQLVAAASITSPTPSLAGDTPTAYATGAAPSMSASPSLVPSRTSTPVPGKTSTPVPGGPVAPAPVATPTPAPVVTPTPAPVVTPTLAPVVTPTPAPVVTPKPAPAVFTTSGVFTVPAGGATLRVLIVAGGGGGGDGGGSGGQSRPGGGGGGGGVIDQTLYVPQGTYNVTVGAGGLRNGNGGNSSFYTLTAVGGGAGGPAENGNGQAGGSGGGGANNGSRGSGTGGQGNDGGDGDHSSPQTAGGGGGASSGGMTATVNQGGFGGAGKASNITGATAYYGGGAGGGACAAGAGPGTGGAGGGGYGGGNNGPQPQAGAAHTGGGGGGSGGYDSGSTAAAAGGSGIVVIAYL